MPFEEIVALKILLKTNEPYFAQNGNKQLVKNNNYPLLTCITRLFSKGGKKCSALKIYLHSKKRSTLGSNTSSER